MHAKHLFYYFAELIVKFFIPQSKNNKVELYGII